MNEVKKDITRIVADVQNGVDGSFDELYHESVRFAYGVASLYLKSEDDIEDVLQNSFMYVSTGIKDLKKPESFYKWLRVIVRHESQKHTGKRARDLVNPLIEFNEDEIETDTTDASLCEFIEKTELRDEISTILGKMPESKRICVVLFYFEQQTIEQIARTLGISEGTVKSRLHGARKIFEKEFKKLGKKDNRLYGVSVVPLITALLAYKVQQAVVPTAVESGVISAVAAGNAAAVSGTAGAAAATASTAGGAAAGSATVAAASGAAAGTAATAVTVKVVAVVSAAAVVAGGAVATKNYIESKQPESIDESSAYISSALYQEDHGTFGASLTEETSVQITDYFSESSSARITSDYSEVLPLTTHALTTVSDTSAVITTRTPVTTQRTTAPTTQRPTTTVAPTTEPSTSQTALLTTAPPTTAVSDAFSVSSGVLTGYKASDSNVSVPATVDGSAVTAIGSGAFSGNTAVKSVSLPSSVTRIGQEAFSDCTNLSSITLPSSLESIGIGAFYGCTSLKTVTIPDGTVSIGDEAFAECSNLSSVTIPSSVTSIGDYAFDGCYSLTVRCAEGSAAHEYAVENSINYELI